MADASTPLMRQYLAIKQQVPHALLLFRLGDFYELFYEDAVTAARELEITLTSRNKERDAIPMCGVPHHAADGYIARLVQKGYRVALCEQMEDPKLAKKLVRREITRIVTPGTVTEPALLRSHENNYLAAAMLQKERAGVAYVDVSTGEFRATELAQPELMGYLESIGAREVLLTGRDMAAVSGLVRTEIEDWVLGQEYAQRSLLDHFHLLSLDGCGLANRPLAVGAAGAVLHYLRDTQRAALDHVEPPRYVDRHESLLLDAATVRNLELVEPLFVGERKDATLLHVLDVTATGMGGRLLRQRLLRPSLQCVEIERRLDQIDALYSATLLRTQLRQQLCKVLDLERLLAKATLGSMTPREMLALGMSLQAVPLLAETIVAQNAPDALREMAACLPPSPLATQILQTLSEEPPVSLADGGTVRAGIHADLDELRDISRNSRQYIAQIEAREKTRTGIQSLKIRFNNVFGYYLEISRANLHLAPADYERKQTLVNAERFTTPELKALEQKVLEAEDRILELERGIFQELRQTISTEAAAIRRTAAGVAELDVACALSQVAVENRYTRPALSEHATELRIVAGRHPVVEKLAQQQSEQFVPNDLSLDTAGQFVALITGPNMGGKSTYLRQAALIAIMAQTGSFVPAAQVSLPVLDRVFTRIGASDNVARGRSTFMVEMSETAAILNTATPRSLVILDEVGRGTSTYDGMAIAWAVIEYIHEQIGARTLFATHYHELTELEDRFAGVRNLRVAVKETAKGILFLRQVEPGRADRSYGIEVARLAAMPRSVIARSREILALHERSKREVAQTLAPTDQTMQIRLFEPVNGQIADRIRTLRLDELRPIEALQILGELQRELGPG